MIIINMVIVFRLTCVRAALVHHVCRISAYKRSRLFAAPKYSGKLPQNHHVVRCTETAPFCLLLLLFLCSKHIQQQLASLCSNHTGTYIYIHGLFMDSYNIWKEAMFTMLCCLVSIRRLHSKNPPPKTQIHSLLVRTGMVPRPSYPVHCPRHPPLSTPRRCSRSIQTTMYSRLREQVVSLEERFPSSSIAVFLWRT